MNLPYDEPELNDRIFDQLVDGALCESERRAVLRRLGDVPDGWRRCALAFLEAQAWREALAAPPASALDAGPSAASGGRRRRPASPARGVFSTYGGLAGAAAGLIVAFASGWAAGGAARPVETARAPAPPRVVADPPPRVPEESASQVSVESARNPLRPVEFVLGPDIDASWLEQDPAVFPDAIRQRLEHDGYVVEQRHALVSMPLGEDSRLAVPVDEAEVRFVGNRTY